MTIGLWNYETNSLLHNISVGERIRSLAISPNGSLLVAGGENDIKIIDLNSGTILKTLPSGFSLAVSFIDDNSHVVSGYLGNIQVWNIDNLSYTEYKNNNYGWIFSIIPMPGTNYLIVGQTLIDKSTGKIISLSVDSPNAKLMSDGTTLLYAGSSYFYFKKLTKIWGTPFE